MNAQPISPATIKPKIIMPITRQHMVGAAAGAAAIIAITTPFLARWEGTDLIAKRDMIGTGHPITYCHGQTSEFGKVKEGQRFTPAQCDALLAQSLPTYLEPLQKCVTQDVPTNVMGALLDAAYNAGPVAVCRSKMVELINAGYIADGCKAFQTWYIRASGRIVQGLINRRKAEMQFCLSGIRS